MAQTIYLPTDEACRAYGIPRLGTRKRVDGLKFLSGPQFNGINIAQSQSTGADDKESRIDEIVLEFIGNQPYVLKFENKATTGGSFQTASFEGQKDDEPILTIQIAPNTTDWVNFTVKHTWGKPGGIISSLFESVTSLIEAGNSILGSVKNVTGEPVRKQNVVFDQADSYQSSDSVEFTVPFLLWSSGGTVEDWVRDVYFPIMLLSAWSHPKRSRTLTAEETIAAATAGKEADARANPNKENDESFTSQVQEFTNKIYPGARIMILDPPSYIRVKHTSGLFTFNRCVISSFNFKYLDPWIKASVPDDVNLNDMDETLLKKALPMRAECSLTLRSIEKTYADDWISMFAAGAGEGATPVRVNTIASNQNTTRTPTSKS